ncbi:MAG: hypothetical protein J1E34_01615 [Oscillospiraceae bacterium]|nr:hypothetical protein [Oscillospiraceae bacterium]
MTYKQGFDAVFIAAGSAEQKMICEALLSSLKEKYDFPFYVLADNNSGARIGSGGALFQVLHTFNSEEELREKKILIVLTGGKSKRAANYAIRGKAFMCIAADEKNEALTFIDYALLNALRFSAGTNRGVVVCCGDIIVDFTGRELCLQDSAAVSVYADSATAMRHGVMFSDSEGMLCDYLQKPSADGLRKYALKYKTENAVPVDAGLVFLSSDYVTELWRLAREALSYVRQCGSELNLFTDILPVNARNITREQFLCSGKARICELIWDRLRKYKLRVICETQPFRHFGTPSEILRNVFSMSAETQSVCINSEVSESAVIETGSLLDNVQLAGKARVGKGCLVTDIMLRDVEVPPDSSVFGIRLKDGRCVACVLRIENDPGAAGKLALESWERPLYYPASSFTDSFRKYMLNSSSQDAVSLDFCVRNADPRFFLDWRQYLVDTLNAAPRENSAYVFARSRLIDEYYANRKQMESLRCVKDCANVKLPARINFSGTWTDCMPYCIENGGEVINAAIRINGIMPICVCAERIEEKHIEMRNADVSGVSEIYTPGGEMQVLSDCNLHRAVFQTLGVGKNTVLEDGIRLTVSVRKIMKGSGLGTSSIVLYGCFCALSDLLGMNLSESDILYCVFIAEQLMHTGGGWQDQGSQLGRGFKSVKSRAGIPQKITVAPIPCSEEFLKKISDRLVLISTGQRHFGRFIVTDVMNRYLERNSDTLRAFSRLKMLNSDMKDCIRREDAESFARCFNLHRENIDLLSPLIYNNKIRKLSEKCLQFADGCSICGAGGGGYMAALLKEGVTVQQLTDTLHTEVLSVEII